MPITVYSPYSGRPVKVRDQDVGRAVRDEDNRIFYVVPRSWGEGYYAAPTRKGSEKDEQRYLDLEKKIEQSEEQAELQMAPVRDATGKRRRSKLVPLLVVLIVLAGVVAAYVLFVAEDGFEWPGLEDVPGTGSPDPPAQPESPPGGPPEPELSTEPAAGANPVPPIALTKPASASTPEPPRAAPPERGEFTTLASGLMFRNDRRGVGEPATAGQFVRLRYRDKSFDSPAALDDQPWQDTGFVLWSGDAPAGWDEALAGMRVGGRRTALIPRPTPRGELRYDVAEFELLETLPGIATATELTGQGPVARPGDTALVQYQAFVQGAEETFVDTRDMGDPGQPVRVTLGAGDVIQGLELGIAGMRVGELRSITIPPHLAYGAKSIGEVVPPHSTLVFVVELVGIE